MHFTTVLPGLVLMGGALGAITLGPEPEPVVTTVTVTVAPKSTTISRGPKPSTSSTKTTTKPSTTVRTLASSTRSSTRVAATSNPSGGSSGKTVPVTWDAGYVKSKKIASIMCSDGANGLAWKYEWDTLGDIPNFPYVGGGEAVKAWNSTGCGTCWQLTYRSRKIYVLAIDYVASGYNLNFEAMDDLTNGHAKELGIIDVVSEPAPDYACQLPTEHWKN